jgi:uncharacterized circularly permuted ATP-grasp superfamily protein/uncharacterized alpha-E superfamily protein
VANATPLFGAEALGRYDEMIDRAGNVRPHWRAVVQAFAAMPADEYARRRHSALRMVRENGVSYNVYDEALGLGRPWQLDIAPFVLGADDWERIAAAVAQRARLADALLADVYGEQRLIRSGALPPQLVLGHPQYLRALHGIRPPGGVYVHCFSADVARAADGSWTVIASRADAPTGLGYALENRIVVSQTFPELFGELGVQRLASFFRQYREAVAGLAGGAKGTTVLLSPGPFNEAYFEHAYLARYLGFELVEGDDLVVRDGAVYLRTVGGLAPVAVIFRRLDSDFADPLELRPDSELGVPGLVDVVRAGNVVVANALGGGVVESPALDAYLPNVARALIGEELLVPDVPTVWCGTAWGRAEALARLRNGIVRDAFDARPLFSRGSSARLGGDLDDDETAALAADLQRRGAAVVVQNVVPLGLAPTFDDGAFASRPMSLRVFAAWTPNGYVVMPGGLARIAADETVRALSMQSGAASKDVWTLARGPIDTFSLLRSRRAKIEIRRSGNEAPSRAMDNLFWLARYAERAEALMRVLRAVVQRLAGDTGGAATSAMDSARRLLAPLGLVDDDALARAGSGDAARLDAALTAAIFGDETGGLQRVLRRIARTAWAARDRLSPDTWRAIYALTAWDPRFEQKSGTFDGANARAYLDTLVRRSAALSGLAAENMTRGNNWLFYDLGRRIERMVSVCSLVRRTFAKAADDESAPIQLALEIADSAMTYSYRYRNAFQASNPRSLAFQVAAIAAHIEELPVVTDAQRHGRARSYADALAATLAPLDLDVLAAADADGARPALRALLAAIERDAGRLADAVGDAYLQHLPRFRA